MKVLLVTVLAIACLQGCSKSEDKNVDSSGACKQDYIDAWNAVERTRRYSTDLEKNSACTSLKDKGSISCKANVTVTNHVGNQSSTERSISYSDYQSYCEASLPTTPTPGPATTTPPSRGNTGNSVPNPTSYKYYSVNGACNSDFIDLYNRMTLKSKVFDLQETLNVPEDGISSEFLNSANDFLPNCIEAKIAKSETASCMVQKRDSYSYTFKVVSISFSEFDSSCARAETAIANANVLAEARSVRVLSKVSELRASVSNRKELFKFNSTSGTTFLLEGKWLKLDQMKNKIAQSALQTAVCNVSTQATNMGSKLTAKEIDIQTSVSTVTLNAANAVEIHEAQISLQTPDKTSKVKVRCLKNGEITLDDIQGALGKAISFDTIKLKK